MEGSAEDLGAPDSWEMADLDESMSRLLVSTAKKTAVSPSPPRELAEEVPPESAASSSSSPPEAVSVGRGGGIPDDVLSQVDMFLREALEKPRERMSILRMEQDIEKFLRDPTQQQLEFQALPTSYLRLAAHRVAQHYCLQSIALPDNNLLDGSGSRIVLCKTSESRFPLVRLTDIPVNLTEEDSNAVVKLAIKQRPQKRSLAFNNANSHSSKTNHQKSVEERKEEYNRARARIFSSNSTGGSVARSEGEPCLPDSFQHCSLVSTRQDGRTVAEGSEVNHGRFLGDSSSGSNRSNRNRAESEPVVSRYKVSNRVAIFRDREVDRKDPDYDRNYDRYMQRFDPGFGFNGGPYAMQAMYTPAVNYNTEFPQLGLCHRPQISMEHQPRPIPQHLRGPWPVTSAPTAIGYGPPEAMMAPFNPNYVGARATSALYMHSSEYPVPPRHAMSFVHPHEHVQSFAQTQQQQHEASFGLARPR